MFYDDDSDANGGMYLKRGFLQTVYLYLHTSCGTIPNAVVMHGGYPLYSLRNFAGPFPAVAILGDAAP
jgi:hypothetical protein